VNKKAILHLIEEIDSSQKVVFFWITLKYILGY